MSLRIGRTHLAWDSIRVEWKPQDLWVGAFYKRSGDIRHLYVCLLPCVPIHLCWWQRKDPR